MFRFGALLMGGLVCTGFGTSVQISSILACAPSLGSPRVRNERIPSALLVKQSVHWTQQRKQSQRVNV
jgi:hypothetical protein